MMNNSLNTAGLSAKQYLVFGLGSEEYAVDILRVQEICIADMSKITRIANSPSYVAGVTNLRGIVVPIIDMRKKFGLEDDVTEKTVIIVTNIVREDKSRIVGFIVDKVNEVVLLDESSISEAPEYTVSKNTTHIEGIATTKDSMLIIMNMHNILDNDEVSSLGAEAQGE